MMRAPVGKTYELPGCTVKYTGTCERGSGNGARSTGIAVMPSAVTTVPCTSRTTAPAGSCTCNPGMAGVVMAVCPVVGDGNLTMCAVSSAVSHTGKGSTAVCRAV